MAEVTVATEELDWEAARTFLAVADAGGLDGAARRLGVHHSTVFRRLSQLESLLGAQLFEREGRHYRPSAAGQAFEPHARRCEDALFALQRAVLGSELVPAGTLRLTTLESLLPYVLPALTALEARCPDLLVELDATTSTRGLDRRQADMALRPSEAPPEDAVGRRIAGVAWAVYGPCASGRLSQSRLQYVGALAQMRAPQAADAALPRLPDGDSPARLRPESVSAMAGAIAQGFGLGPLPCYIGDVDARLRRVGEPQLLDRSGLWLLMHPDLRDSARIRAVIDLLVPSLMPHVARFEGRGEGQPRP